MRKAVQPPVLQDVCIFCTVRRQFALHPPSATLSPQRRNFRLHPSLLKPPVEALAQIKSWSADEDAVSQVQNRNDAPPEQNPISRDNKPNGSRSAIRYTDKSQDRGSGWVCVGCQWVNHGSRVQCLKCRRGRADLVPKYAKWNCRTCGHLNSFNHSRCSTCNEPSPNGANSNRFPFRDSWEQPRQTSVSASDTPTFPRISHTSSVPPKSRHVFHDTSSIRGHGFSEDGVSASTKAPGVSPRNGSMSRQLDDEPSPVRSVRWRAPSNSSFQRAHDLPQPTEPRKTMGYESRVGGSQSKEPWSISANRGSTKNKSVYSNATNVQNAREAPNDISWREALSPRPSNEKGRFGSFQHSNDRHSRNRPQPREAQSHGMLNDAEPYVPEEAQFEPVDLTPAILSSSVGAFWDNSERKHPRKRDAIGDLARSSRLRPQESITTSNRPSRMRNRRAERMSDYDEDFDDEREEAKAKRKQQRKREREARERNAPPTPIHLPEFISVSNLAKVLKVRVEAFAEKMKELGFEETTNDHVLDAEIAGLIAAEFNFEPIVEESENVDIKAQPPVEDRSGLPQRPPIVTIMGHVDHGKTTLLDYLRRSSVAASEHGGITQHIGAFSVRMPGGRLVTFLDTPGHAAFLSMRQRGANVTDIVILVVAADDSVKPQTIEAIKHARAAKVPMIVAINKIDKDEGNIERVKQDLARYEVEIEDFGGDTQVVPVSGKTGQGMKELEDAAVALADVLDMRAEDYGQVEGWVLEATTKKAGRLATVLIRRGTLKPGDVIVAGFTWTKVRTLKNEAGAEVPEAKPGTPVEVDGWRDQPVAGDEVLQADTEHQAKSAIDFRLVRLEKDRLAVDMTAVNEARRIEQERRDALEALEEQKKSLQAAGVGEARNDPPQSDEEKDQKVPIVNLIVKADVSGSTEAVTTMVSGLGSSQISPSILRASVGQVSESDIMLAAAAPAHILSFNQVTDGNIRRLADSQGVKILEERIIYRLADMVKEILEDKLPRVITKRILGEAEVAQIFDINVRGRIKVPVAGCRVRNGIVGRAMKMMVKRGEEGKVVYDGNLSSLKNQKKDVTEMGKGAECGMGFEKWSDFRVGDLVQGYEEKSERRKL